MVYTKILFLFFYLKKKIMKRSKTDVPEKEKILPLYVVEHFYLLEEALGVTLKKEKEELRNAVLEKLNEMCNEHVTFYIGDFDSDISFFFKNKPENTKDVVDMFVAAITVQHKENRIRFFCAQKVGRAVLNQYVFPLIAEDDFHKVISLSAVTSAIGFYFKQGFDFVNFNEAGNFNSLIKKYGFDNVTNWLQNKPDNNNNKPDDVVEFHKHDSYAMFWKRNVPFGDTFVVDFLESVQLFKHQHAIYAGTKFNPFFADFFAKFEKKKNFAVFDMIIEKINNFDKTKNANQSFGEYDKFVKPIYYYIKKKNKKMEMISTQKERVLPQKTEGELYQILQKKEEEDQNEMQMSDDEINASISVCAHCNNTINNYDPFVVVTKNSKYCGTICQKKQEIKKVF